MAGIDWPLLKSVSRSFYLTLRLLPAPVREPISLAYLLARLSDTKADGAVTEGEKALLKTEPALLVQLECSDERAVIEHVWRTIQEGQQFDQTRFVPDAAPLSDEERDRYTYLVAGCVGEFWTKVCARKIPDFSRRSPAEMAGLGIAFGQGLQLINILRDRAADRALGRVYLPEEKVSAVISQARACLDRGETYARSLRGRRLRAATALPLLIGRKTLDLLEKSPGDGRIKVPRATVWRLFLSSLVF